MTHHDAPVSSERLEEIHNRLDDWAATCANMGDYGNAAEYCKIRDVFKALRKQCERKCEWVKLDHSRYESCVSIHHVPLVNGEAALPAFCECCGGAVVVGSPSSAADAKA